MVNELTGANDAENLAVLVVDMQELYLKNISHRERLVANHITLLQACARKDIPTISFGIRWTNESDKAYDSQLETKLRNLPRHEYVEKDAADGFKYHNGNSPERILRRWGVSKVLVTGIQANICVLHTITGARRSGFNVVTSPDLIDDRDEMKLFDAQSYFSHIRVDCLPLHRIMQDYFGQRA